jgi:1-acyl-sn-glycerol-3-phosphate acyltransferase
MAEVRHSEITWRLFDLGFSPFRALHLRATRFGGVWPEPIDGRPLVLVANHISWWDGFLLREIQRHVRPGRPFHTVVVEHLLDMHPMLRRLGGIPIRPESPSSVLGMLRTFARLRGRDANTVFSYFPQGRVWPSSRRPLALRRGIEAVGRILAPARIVPVSIHIEPVVHIRPTPFLWLGQPVDALPDAPVATELVAERIEAGLDEIRERLDRWGEDVNAEWIDALEPRTAHLRSGADAGPESTFAHTT